MLLRAHLPQYAYLMRLHRPIGILLLLWPTLWALWLASAGKPDKKILFIFIAGVVLMRSAGCIINDFADRQFDGYVSRTKDRPLATGAINPVFALSLALLLSLTAFSLVLMCNQFTIWLAFVGAALAILYPFLKRFTSLPQVGLGVAYTWGVPMAFAAQTGSISLAGWFLFLTGMVWPIIYDTLYAMVDREDDIKIGINSTAILFGDMDKAMVGLLQMLFTVMLIIVGLMFRLHSVYYISLSIVAVLFLYQQWLIKDRIHKKCFSAFLNNNLVGLVIFAGIALNYL